ncbi:MAG: DUF2752 domain-containing protein [Synergistaceae bacterium]|nr:DUF2752 domain-containing protein [Synergistaceae bacterium]
MFSLPTFCLWKLLFGLPCPGCGLTRACLLLARGRFIGAAARNILIIPFLAAACGVFSCFLADAVFHKRYLDAFLIVLTSKPAIAASAVLALLSWGYNIAIGN